MHRDRYELNDEQWSLIAPLLPCNGLRGGQWRDHRTMINGILWVLGSGAAWRDLPQRYGPWQTAHGRLLAWRRDGTWENVLAALAHAGQRAWADRLGAVECRHHQHPRHPSRRRSA